MGVAASEDQTTKQQSNPTEPSPACQPDQQPPLNGGSPDDALRLPDGFELRADGLHYQTKEGSVWVCAPIEVRAQARDEKRDAWSKLVHFVDNDGLTREWILPAELLVEGFLWLQRLADMGLRYSQEHRSVLRSYLHRCNPSRRLISVTRTGWHDRTHVLPDQIFGPPLGNDAIYYQPDPTIDHSFRQAGTLSEWRENVSKYCRGNSRLTFCVSMAFAAAVQYLLGAESGGINFTGGSSIGKTTMLIVAGSVWGGGGMQGYKRQWRATLTGLEGVAAMHSDALLALDEMSQIDAREAAQVAYLLANGQGKSRGRRDGSPRPPATWRSFFLSTGENTLADKISEDGRRKATAGTSVRVVDVPAGVGDLGAFETIHQSKLAKSFADALRNRAERYYGTAIREFLTRLVLDLDGNMLRLREHRDECLKGLNLGDCDGQVHRVASRFALIAAAGQLATEFGITGWEKGDACLEMKKCFAAWTKKRGYTGPQEIEAGIKQIRKFIEEHGESRFTPNGGYGRIEPSTGTLVELDRPTINRVGFRDAEGKYYVLPEAFRTVLCVGFDHIALADALMKRGMLIPANEEKNGKKRTSRLERIPANGGEPARFYVLQSILEGEEEI